MQRKQSTVAIGIPVYVSNLLAHIIHVIPVLNFTFRLFKCFVVSKFSQYCPLSVSYTHLDVYKRQTKDNIVVCIKLLVDKIF